MMIDFRRKRTVTQPLCILGEDVGVLDYKYLSVHIDTRLNWKTNIEAAYKKGKSRLFPEEAEMQQDVRNLPVCCDQFTVLWSAGRAALEPATPTDLINCLRRTAP